MKPLHAARPTPLAARAAEADTPGYEPRLARRLDDDAEAAVRRIHLGRLAVTIAVVWLAATVVFVILGFFGESEESGTALRLL